MPVCLKVYHFDENLYRKIFFFPIAFQFLAQPVKEVKPIMFV